MIIEEGVKVLHIHQEDLLEKDGIMGCMVNYIFLYSPLTLDILQKSPLFAAIIPMVADVTKFINV